MVMHLSVVNHRADTSNLAEMSRTLITYTFSLLPSTLACLIRFIHFFTSERDESRVREGGGLVTQDRCSNIRSTDIAKYT